MGHLRYANMLQQLPSEVALRHIVKPHPVVLLKLLRTCKSTRKWAHSNEANAAWQALIRQRFFWAPPQVLSPIQHSHVSAMNWFQHVSLRDLDEWIPTMLYAGVLRATGSPRGRGGAPQQQTLELVREFSWSSGNLPKIASGLTFDGMRSFTSWSSAALETPGGIDESEEFMCHFPVRPRCMGHLECLKSLEVDGKIRQLRLPVWPLQCIARRSGRQGSDIFMCLTPMEGGSDARTECIMDCLQRIEEIFMRPDAQAAETKPKCSHE